MIAFTYSDNSETVEKALEAFESALADNRPTLAEIADDFREMIQEQFATEGRAGGTPWAPLAPATLRRRRGAGSTILYSTGALERSFLDPLAAEHVGELDPSSNVLTLGSRLPYAQYHQAGTRHMPARPIIVLSSARGEKWVEIVRAQIEEKAQLLGEKELEGTKL